VVNFSGTADACATPAPQLQRYGYNCLMNATTRPAVPARAQFGWVVRFHGLVLGGNMEATTEEGDPT